MAVSRIVSIEETTSGGLYVVVEFRHEASDPEPFLVEDFRWTEFSTELRPRRRRDEYGRVLIQGSWVWPHVFVDGDRVPRPDLDQAQMETPSLSEDELFDRIVEKVLEYAERHDLDGSPDISGDRTLAESRKPPRRTRASSPQMRSVVANLSGTNVTETLATVSSRRKSRQRP